MISKTIPKKCKKIKLIITDVDGVLTDGGVYCNQNEEFLKKFNVKDGMGFQILRESVCAFLRNHGIKTVFLTSENSKFAKVRGKKVKADAVYINIPSKEKKLPDICKKFNLTPNQIAYIGDDVNDLEIMKKIGLSACPSDAVSDIKQKSDFICSLKGGEGVFREFSELILKHQVKT